MPYVLKLFRLRVAYPQWSSGLRNILDHLGRGFESYSFTYFFFFQIEETCTFMNISSLKYHLIDLFTDTAAILT